MSGSSGAVAVADDETMKFGLLMESAQAHQKLAEAHLERLRAHTQDLDHVVREEIRQTLIDEFRSLTAESDRTARALRDVKRAASIRAASWKIVVAALCTAIPCAIAHFALPSRESVAALRTERDELARNIQRLEKRAGKVDWRNCGPSARLCVRVNRKEPAYGATGDYLVVQGY
jgi:hypothetical protein